jgi:hypothetical protein
VCCFAAVLGLFGPRLAVLFAWLFTDRIQLAFNGGWLAPLVGILLLPWTTLAFIVAYAPVDGVSSLGWLIVIFGLLGDISSYASGGKARSNSR